MCACEGDYEMTETKKCNGYKTIFPDGRSVALYYSAECERFLMVTTDSDGKENKLSWTIEGMLALFSIFMRMTTDKMDHEEEMPR